MKNRVVRVEEVVTEGNHLTKYINEALEKIESLKGSPSIRDIKYTLSNEPKSVWSGALIIYEIDK
jgi:hypothetical protein